MKRGILFINGSAPSTFPNISGYEVVGCTDGAFHYLYHYSELMKGLTFVSGDFDSLIYDDLRHSTAQFSFEIIPTPDQNKTDFEKALDIFIEKEISHLDVYGASGNEMDHFMGNISAALAYKERICIKFHDEYATFYFLRKNEFICDVKSKMISLYPFPVAKNITTYGLNWDLQNDEMEIGKKIGTRNFAKQKDIEITFDEGNLMIFIGKTNYKSSF